MRKANHFLLEFVSSSDTSDENAIQVEHLQRYDKVVSRAAKGCAVLQKNRIKTEAYAFRCCLKVAFFLI